MDEENGINWYWFNPGRYYPVRDSYWSDPEIGKFLSVDPHHYSYPDLSPYNYVGNNPLRFIDPTGMDSTEANNNNNDNTNNANVAETVTFTVLITELLKEFGVTALNIAKGGAVGVLLVLATRDSRQKAKTNDKGKRNIDDVNNPNEWPENPDEWSPPEGVKEVIKTKEVTKGKHRIWKNKDGKIVRRWDKTGRSGGKERGPH